MGISDRTLGYISLFALLCIFGGIAYGMWNAHHEATTSIWVDFYELGTLQPEDQVVIRGYTVGSIGTVQWLGDRSRVQINFNQPIVIREGTQFNNVNYAIMGQRRLEVIPSKTGKVLSEDYIHQGTFEPGIAEMLRHIEQVNDQVATIREVVHLVLEGDSLHRPVNQILEESVSGIENTLASTEQTLKTLQPTLNDIFKQVDGAGVTLESVALQADSIVKISTETINQKIQMAEKAIATISEGAKKTNEIIVAIENDSLYRDFLYTTGTVSKVNELVDKLNEIVKAIDTKGIKVLDDNGKPVKLFTWKNINLIGKTAREKAAERAKKQLQ